jgi:type II secretory pathway pseudopilin PulG
MAAGPIADAWNPPAGQPATARDGFTLIELLILGVLAAIALPAFFNQTTKAGDAKTKELAHTAQTAMEACATDKDGTYSKTSASLPTSSARPAAR